MFERRHLGYAKGMNELLIFNYKFLVQWLDCKLSVLSSSALVKRKKNNLIREEKWNIHWLGNSFNFSHQQLKKN